MEKKRLIGNIYLKKIQKKMSLESFVFHTQKSKKSITNSTQEFEGFVRVVELLCDGLVLVAAALEPVLVEP